jgi:hypothetical protein
MWLICPPGEEDLRNCYFVLAKPWYPWDDDGLPSVLDLIKTLGVQDDLRNAPWVKDLLRLSSAAELVAGLTQVPAAKRLETELFEAGRALVEANAPQVTFRTSGG